LECSAVYNAPSICDRSLSSHFDRSLPHLPLDKHAEETIPTFITSNIYIGIFLPKALAKIQPRSYKIQHQGTPSGNSKLPAAKRRVTVLASERDTSQSASSVHSTMPGQNSTPSSSVNNSHVADITQCMASTLHATL
jgi:hypothetical protein